MKSVLLVVSGCVLMITVVAMPVRACTGDCSGDGQVTVDELTLMTTVVLTGGSSDCDATAGCPGQLAVDCILIAIGHALDGCPEQSCLGDCNGDGQVDEGEVSYCVQIPIILIYDPARKLCCGDTVDDLVTLANNHLNGCL